MESILTSVKKMLGIAADYEHFDPELIIHINSALNLLTQLGVGPEEGFAIVDEDDVWESFIGETSLLNMVKTLVFMKVKMVFDPPTISSVRDSYERQISELEWRINVEVDKGEFVKEDNSKLVRLPSDCVLLLTNKEDTD